MDDAEQIPSPFDDPPLRFSLRTLLLFVTCFAVACAVIRWAAIAHNRWNSRRERENQIRQIGLGLLNYQTNYRRFPPAYIADAQGKPLLSWRFVMLPYFESSTKLYSSFNLNEPWDGPNNGLRSQTMFTIYHCPVSAQQPPLTDYVAVVGPNTAWPGAKGSKLSDFKDPSKTILVVEVANSGINWAEPRDLSVEEIVKGIRGNHAGGFNAVFADAHVEFISDDIDPKKLAEMFEINPRGDQPK
jgi:prepilin-type processing-associated H-X9-DG protein